MLHIPRKQDAIARFPEPTIQIRNRAAKSGGFQDSRSFQVANQQSFYMQKLSYVPTVDEQKILHHEAKNSGGMLLIYWMVLRLVPERQTFDCAERKLLLISATGFVGIWHKTWEEHTLIRKT